MKKTCEPKWNQTFVYAHVHRRDFRNHMLELTIWDQPRSPEEDSTFMGEVPPPSPTVITHTHSCFIVETLVEVLLDPEDDGELQSCSCAASHAIRGSVSCYTLKVFEPKTRYKCSCMNNIIIGLI